MALWSFDILAVKFYVKNVLPLHAIA